LAIGRHVEIWADLLLVGDS
jgi:outer membrane murein-binding lipoprotein Lpp